MALSTCSESYCGIASTFASRPFHEVSEKSVKLHSVLKNLGYRIDFFISGDHRSWKYLRKFYGNNVDQFDDYVANSHYAVDDDRKILEDLERVAAFSGQPSFFYIFLMSLLKYIRCGSSRSDWSEELYDLDSDPGERINLLATARSELVTRLRWELDSRFVVTTNRCDSFECVD